MKKNGFTLIELLAVIVILAIIALIATPIILGIINDARKESNERSAELYASSVKNAIASYQLTHPNAPIKFTDLDIQYDGNVECATKELYTDGSFYITDCTVNGTEVEYTYGTEPTRYYSWGSGSIGEDLPSDAKSTLTELNPSYPYYLGLDVDSSNKVIAAYACSTFNGQEYCLKGYDTEAFATNTSILEGFEEEITCNFNETRSYCFDDFDITAYSDGSVSMLGPSNLGDSAECYVSDEGDFGCDEW